MLKYILLGFLNYQSMTGYQLKSIMDESTMHFWHAYHSQIYTTLRKLEDDGLLTSEVEGDDDKLNRRVYTITEVGRAELRAWLDSPLMEPVPAKEDLLVRVFFSAGRARGEVLEELRLQRRLHQQQLDHYHFLAGSGQVGHLLGEVDDPDAIGADVRFWAATLRYGMAYEQMYLNWLDETIVMVESS